MGRDRREREDGAAAWPVVLSAALLAGAVAAAVAAAAMRLGPVLEPGFVPADAPRIASVRLGEIAARYAVNAAGESSSAEAASADARAWAAALETALARVAERRRAVLLPARAVAAGAPDLTPDVEAALAAILARTRSNGPAAEAGP